MPLIGFQQQATAHLIAHYLNKQGINVTVNTHNQHGYVVELSDENERERATAIVKEFLDNPHHTKYQDAAWQDGESLRTTSLTTLPRISMRTMFSFPIVALILVICSLVFLASWFGGLGVVRDLLMIQPLGVMKESAQWWRLITPAFIHFSAMHIVFNLLWWWVLGRSLERHFGSVFLFVFLCATAMASNLGQLMVSGPNFGGLSGVVYALFGFVWWTGWLKPAWGIGLPKHIIGFMLIWLVIGYLDVLWVSMANTAHTSGLVSGCLIAWLMCTLSKK